MKSASAPEEMHFSQNVFHRLHTGLGKDIALGVVWRRELLLGAGLLVAGLTHVIEAKRQAWVLACWLLP